MQASSAATTPSVVIVGAGLSGLTAAHELSKVGIKIPLYEGRDRVGGRVSTHYFNEKKTQWRAYAR